MRFNLYTFIHTAIRGLICELTVQAGRTSYSKPEQVTALASRTRLIVEFLKKHGEHEDEDIHPVLKAKDYPGFEELEQEHANTNDMLFKLREKAIYLDRKYGIKNDEPPRILQGEEAMRAKEAGLDFYHDVSQFGISYGQHMLTEEKNVMLFLQQRMSDEELFVIHMAIQKKVPVSEVIDPNISLVYPYIEHEEAVMVTKGLQKAFPQQFGDICMAIKRCLKDTEWKSIFADAQIPYEEQAAAARFKM